MNHQHLIQGCIKGERHAQEAIYEAYAPKMFAVCLRYAPDRATAEDMLQDGFIKVFTKIDSYKGEGELGAWIRRVVVNVALEHLRKLQTTGKRVVDLDLCYHLYSSEDIIEQLTFKEVMEAIQQIPEGYREVLNLYAIDGYSHKEIAKMVNITEGNSKQRLRRARNMLAKIIAAKTGILVDETAA